MLLEKVIQQAVERPDGIAIVDDRRTLTYRELVWAANVMAGHVDSQAAAVGGTDLIGLLIPPSGAFAVALGGTRWTSRIAVPLNYLLKPAEMEGVVRDAGLKLIFTIKHFEAFAEQFRALGIKVVFMEDLAFAPPTRLQKLSAVIRAPWAPLRGAVRAVPPRLPDDVAVILYTSGTSGVPKGVMLTNRNLESNAQDSVRHARFTEKTVFLGVLPMFHTLGLMANCLIPLMLGCKVIYQARFSPAAVFEAIAKHQCEVLIAVPTMYAVLAAAKSAQPDSLKSLRFALSGGEPLPVTLIESFQAKFGLTLMEGFGLTETSPIVALCTPWAHKPGSVGQLIPEVQIRLLADDGRVLGPNEDGELLIKGPNVMKGYFHKPADTAAVFTADGYFKTGDIARIDDDGFLYITGRKKDMIIMAGEKVYPREIEDAIKQHPAVLVSAVIGAKDPARGEAPVAFVQLRPDVPAAERPSAQELRAFVRERIAPYKAPREVIFLDEIPRSGTGKIMKRDLAKLLPVEK